MSEHLKLAYGEKQHAGLTRVAANQGTGSSKGVRDIMVKGTLQTDSGIRHPWLPTSDKLHSFSGSQTQQQIGRNVAETQGRATSDIAKSIALNEKAKGQGRVRGAVTKLRSRAAGYRGAKDLGQASHQLADISAHHAKPTEMGIASKLRDRLPKSGYGGGIASGLEHRSAGLTGTASKLDEMKPSASAVDAQAVSRQRGFGRASGQQVRTKLVQQHGLTPTQAAQAHQQFMHSPGFGRTGRVAGEATRDLRYVGSEGKRLVTTAGKALRKGGRRLLLRR